VSLMQNRLNPAHESAAASDEVNDNRTGVLVCLWLVIRHRRADQERKLGFLFMLALGE
jgi:hypothetical protein